MEEVVLLRVLPHLPLKNLCQCKAVSKSWNQTLSSTWFLQGPWQETQNQSRSDTSSPTDWIVMQVRSANRVRELVAYDPTTANWLPLGRPHERPVIGSAAKQQLVSVYNAEAKFAAMKGLVCIVFNRITPAPSNNYYLRVAAQRRLNSRIGGLVILVLNPLTGSYKVIPAPEIDNPGTQQYIPTVQMIDGESGSVDPAHRIFLRSTDAGVPRGLLVFDSATSRWKSAGVNGETTGLGALPHADFVSYDARAGRLSAYHVASDAWSHVTIPLPHDSLHSSHVSATINHHDDSAYIRESFTITQSGGTILLSAPVQILQPANSSNSFAVFALIGFAVWRLLEDITSGNGNVFRWTELSRTPASDAFPLPYPLDVRSLLQHKIKLLSSDSSDVICMSLTSSSYIHHSYSHLVDRSSYTPLLYSISSGKWQHLPPLPSGVADLYDSVTPAFFLNPAFANTTA